MMTDEQFNGVPFRMYGRDFAGADCVGIVALFLSGALGYHLKLSDKRVAGVGGEAEMVDLINKRTWSERGDVIFFQEKRTGRIRHVAVALGDGRVLHSTKHASRIDHGTRLIERMGFRPVGAIAASDRERLERAIALCELGDVSFWTVVVLLVISVGLSVASYALAGKPKLGRIRPQKGAYSYDSQYTQISSELPLPDILGAVHIAGNAIYTTLQDKNTEVTSPEFIKMNRVIVFCSGPAHAIDSTNYNIRVNGIHFDSKYWKNQTVGGVNWTGWYVNPAQTRAEAVAGNITISGQAFTNLPTMTLYTGAHGISVPVDIRASYDRNFPVYGLSGCCYLVARFFNAEKMGSLNISATVEGRYCRPFDEDGFVVTSTTDNLTGASATTRYKLTYDDVIAVSSLTVAGSGWTEMSEANQTGNVFYVNRLKGYIEFPSSAPTAGQAIVVNYTCYVREWTKNPAMHLVYLLTDTLTGKGFPESKVDWERAVELRDHCDEEVVWGRGIETVFGPRYTANYIIDSRASLQEHLDNLVSIFGGWLFLSNGKVVMKARKAESSVFAFTESNMLKGSFSSEVLDRRERANRVRVFIRPSDTYTTETEVTVDDKDDQAARAGRIGNDGVVEETLHMPGIDTLGQAERYAEERKRENLRISRSCQFKTTLRGLAIEPGDVVTITNSADPYWTSQLARVEDVEMDEQDRLTLRCSEYSGSVFI